MPQITKVNIYTVDGRWYYAAWSGEAYDHNDSIDAESEVESREWVAAQWPTATVARV